MPRTSDSAAVIARILAGTPGHVSGEKLARETGISRVAVRKHVRRLIDGGAEIEAARGAGYRLVRLPERPDALGIAALRKGPASTGSQRIGFPVEHHARIGSTNDRVSAAARDGAAEGFTVTADVQEGGRGRRGRAWDSPAGGLYLSVLLRPRVPPARLTLVGLVAALAMTRALDDLGVDGTAIKWPNDVVVEDRKLAGVLVEAAADAERVMWAVIGVGVNVASVPRGLGGAAASVRRLPGGRTVTRAMVAAAFLDALEPLLDRLDSGPADTLLDEVAARCVTLGTTVRVVGASGEAQEGEAIGLAPDGSLRLAKDGREVSIASGDVLRA